MIINQLGVTGIRLPPLVVQVKARTSTVPFAAIVDGRQKLPKDYWKEFARWPYVAVTCFTLGAYICHPLMQQASYSLHW